MVTPRHDVGPPLGNYLLPNSRISALFGRGSARTMTGTYLLTGHSGPLSVVDTSSIQRIADALAGSGIMTVRIEDLELAAIELALADSNGNRTHAARSLGISVRTLQRKLKSLERPMPLE